MKKSLILMILGLSLVSVFAWAEDTNDSLSFEEALTKLPNLRYSFIAFCDLRKTHSLDKWQKDVIGPSINNSDAGFLGEIFSDAEWYLDLRITNRKVNKKFQRRYEKVQPETEEEELKIYKKAGQSVNFVTENALIIRKRGFEKNIIKGLAEESLNETSYRIDGRYVYEFKGKLHQQNDSPENIFLFVNIDDSEIIVSSEISFLKKYMLVKQGIDFPASDDDLWTLFKPAAPFLKDKWILIVPEKIEDILEKQSQAYGYTHGKKEEMRAKLKDMFYAGRAFSKHVDDGVLVDITFDFRPMDTPLRKMLEYKQTSINVRKNALKNWSRNFDAAIGRVKVWHKDNYVVTEVRSRNLREAWEYGYSNLTMAENELNEGEAKK